MHPISVDSLDSGFVDKDAASVNLNNKASERGCMGGRPGGKQHVLYGADG